MTRRISEILAGFESLPSAGVDTILQGQRPLIFAPHPDDESLGCGGLIAAACAAGIAPVVVILTDGSASHPGSQQFPPAKLAAIREQETIEATRLLGLPRGNLHFFRQPDGALATQGDVFQAMLDQAASLGKRHGCGLVVGPWAGDPHCDHEAAARIAASVATNCGWKLLSYPVWGWLREPDSHFDETNMAGWRLDISAFLPAKSRAIAAHASQFGALITDSPDGFVLPENLLALFRRPFEVFAE